MGNSCVRPNLANNGFLQSVSNAVWKGRRQQELPNPEKEKEKEKDKEKEKEKEKENSSKDGSNSNNEKEKPEVVSSPKDPNITQSTAPALAKMDSKRAKGPEPPQPNVYRSSNTNNKPADGSKPIHMKRVSSVGLQVQSVLESKAGNLKEFYSLGRKLGQGQFGTTFYCLEKGTGKEFACKSIAKRKLTTTEDVEDMRREIRIMHHMSGHPNMISIVGAYEDAVDVHVVMELCTGGELFERIIQRGHYTEKKAAELARVIVTVVDVCHSLGVMHRDLKPENFLFVNEEEDSPLKVIDFGLSVFFKPGKNNSYVFPFYSFLEIHVLLLH